MPGSEGIELALPVRGDFDADNEKHRRNLRALEAFMHAPFVSSAKIQDAAIHTAHIDDAQITNAKIDTLSVDKLTSGELSADVVVAGSIKTSLTGQRAEMDTNGIRGTDGVSDNFNLPTVGEAALRGGVEATGLTVTGPAEFRGENELAEGGRTLLAAGVGTPASAPIATWVYDYIGDGGAGPTDPTRRMAGFDQVTNRILVASPADQRLDGFNATTGAHDWALTGSDKAFRGISRLGLKIWVVYSNPGAQALRRYDLDGAGIPTTSTSDAIDLPAGALLMGLTNDGTDLWVGWLNNAGDFRVSRVSTSWAVLETHTIETGLDTATRTPFDIERSATDGALWWIPTTGSAAEGNRIRAYDASFNRVLGAEFLLPTESRGIAWDGSKFWTIPYGEHRFRTHTAWTPAANPNDSKVHVAYAWYDTGGVDETTVSPYAIATNPRRAKLRITIPPIPGGANRARVYVLENTSMVVPGSGAAKLQAEISAISVDLSNYAPGAADQTVNGFPASGTAHELVSAVAGMRLAGDGVMVLPKFPSNPVSPVLAQIYFNTTVNKARVYNGTSFVDLW